VPSRHEECELELNLYSDCEKKSQMVDRYWIWKFHQVSGFSLGKQLARLGLSASGFERVVSVADGPACRINVIQCQDIVIVECLVND